MSSRPQQAPCRAEDREALDACFTRLYDNIRHLAARLGWTSVNPTLNATALAHEAYLKLRGHPPDLANKSHQEVIAIFANAMRQVLIDAARRRNSKKHVQDFLPGAGDSTIEDVIAVAQALDELSKHEPTQARIAEARFLLGMTSAEIGAALGISVRTVEREWQAARQRLAARLQTTRE